ncbi:hypothetical protein PHYSODRAFT_295070 [Phytophthora sojae]|uniref:Uncharacterized protein n=1 Tax=Phytophthora sojae (strain P6497) TaxID=1094619 RepID=G4YNC9_PHYSP|nr:hypothetical protein PHYSODRAFT_295070 [Phytophthora sojae]EGZ30222.1 hypothetical protein PHYSODRAFT_295070 [Phytophthora sojae]|eukprot:XP_009517497.1 hypothetical protein PHYSODRAFT_295070 [Phytophthora sojae]
MPRAKTNNDGAVLLKDVLRRNGEEHLYDEALRLTKHAATDPPVIFDWKHVDKFVQGIVAANTQAAEGDAPLALLAYDYDGKADPLGTTCRPCDCGEATRAVECLGRLNEHPWTQHIIAVGGAGNVLPVADLYAPKPRTNKLEHAIRPRPNGLWNMK